MHMHSRKVEYQLEYSVEVSSYLVSRYLISSDCIQPLYPAIVPSYLVSSYLVSSYLVSSCGIQPLCPAIVPSFCFVSSISIQLQYPAIVSSNSVQQLYPAIQYPAVVSSHCVQQYSIVPSYCFVSSISSQLQYPAIVSSNSTHLLFCIQQQQPAIVSRYTSIPGQAINEALESASYHGSYKGCSFELTKLAIFLHYTVQDENCP